MNSMLTLRITDRMENRMKGLFSSIAICLGYEYDSYYIAGNSCNATTPNDFDLYPVSSKFNFAVIGKRLQSVNGYVVCETRNAMTCNIGGKVVQFCNYMKPSLKSLVESFDFAHIQVGARVTIKWRPVPCVSIRCYEASRISEVYFTDEWLNAHALETTWFTGSEYPLSSLMRLQKYAQRGCYSSKHECRVDALKILGAIISRGYQNYDDYKDQLDAIDMLLLGPDEQKVAQNFYNICCDKLLVTEEEKGC